MRSYSGSTTATFDAGDGSYALLASGFDIDNIVELPVEVGPPGLATGPDHALVVTFGKWEPVLVIVTVRSSPPEPPHPSSWEASLTGHLEVTQDGSLLLADDELAPFGGEASVQIGAGRYHIQIATRSSAFTVKLREGLPADADMESEQHAIDIWPAI